MRRPKTFAMSGRWVDGQSHFGARHDFPFVLPDGSRPAATL